MDEPINDDQLDAVAEYQDETGAEIAYARRWRCSDGLCGAEDCTNCRPR